MSGLLTHQAAGAETRGPNGRSTPAQQSRLAAAKVYPLPKEALEAILRDDLERQGIRIRRDRIARDLDGVEKVKRWAIAEDSPTIRLTHAQGAALIGSKQDMTSGGDCKTLVRMLNTWERLGVLTWGGTKTRAGRWICLEITLLPTVGEDVSEPLKCSIAHLM